MKNSFLSASKNFLHQSLRRAVSCLPRSTRYPLYRALLDCDPRPDRRLQLKVADTQQELEACFRLLHDAYVGAGLMRPDPSGMRTTIYHCLPTTTTLCAKVDGKVVGTVSLIREGVFGFPLQSAFSDLTRVREKTGAIAEVSALAVHPDYRRTGGAVLFPLMKFMYEYCTSFFDTRHLVIAVHPKRIEMFESLFFFERLQQNTVKTYDFVNGAPAVGATLDLLRAPERMRQAYGSKKGRKNLYEYFVNRHLPNIQFPESRDAAASEPVMTPEMLDYFFKRQGSALNTLEDRRKQLLYSIYDLTAYRRALPALVASAGSGHPLRKHRRYSLKCPGLLELQVNGRDESFRLRVIEVSMHGFKAECDKPLPLNHHGFARIELGAYERSVVEAVAVRLDHSETARFYGFLIETPDAVWCHRVASLEHAPMHVDLEVEAA